MNLLRWVRDKGKQFGIIGGLFSASLIFNGFAWFSSMTKSHESKLSVLEVKVDSATERYVDLGIEVAKLIRADAEHMTSIQTFNLKNRALREGCK